MKARRRSGGGASGVVRVGIVSDLHAERGIAAAWRVTNERQRAPAADIGLVAGDCASSRSSAHVASSLFPEAAAVVLVGGNHEHYGTGESVDEGIARMRADALELSAPGGRRVAVLENQALVLDPLRPGLPPVRVLGCTLWTDYALDGDAERAMRLCETTISDHGAIRGRDDSGTPGGPGRFRATEARDRHRESVAFLRAELARPFSGGPTVVLTHHLPSRRSIHPIHAAARDNAAFASDLDDLIGLGAAALWAHGHTHSSALWRDAAGGTLVACNPAGYQRGLIGLENPAFDTGFAALIRPSRDAPGGWVAEPEGRAAPPVAAPAAGAG